MTDIQILMLVTPFVLLAVVVLGAWLAVKKGLETAAMTNAQIFAALFCRRRACPRRAWRLAGGLQRHLISSPLF